MTDVRDEDLKWNEFDVLARELEETARLWRTYGRNATDVAASWSTGPRSPALQPSRGSRYEECDDPACAPACDSRRCAECPNPDSDDPAERTHVHEKHRHLIPGDPTGESTVEASEPDRSALLRANVTAVKDAAWQIRSIVRQTTPAARDAAPPRRDETRDEIARAGWCVSCYRLEKRCEPIAKSLNTKTGEWRIQYAEFCRWCGDLRAEWADTLGVQGLPPIELVRLHHTQGKRVTEKKIIDAMAKHVAQQTGDKTVRRRTKTTRDEGLANARDRRARRRTGASTT